MFNRVKRTVRQRLTYANVVASVAAFGALAGGGAYAAGQLDGQAKAGKIEEVRADKTINTEQGKVTAKCPQGTRVISGGSGSGISDTAANSDVAILESHKSTGNGWIVIGVTQTGPRTIHAYAYCEKK